jgi:hypothetical protein
VVIESALSPAPVPVADVAADPDETRRPVSRDDDTSAVTWCLVPDAGGERPLFPGGGVTIGRSSDAADPERVVVRSDVVSRRHAGVRLRDGAPVVVDLGSANGTWLYRGGDHIEVAEDGTPAEDGDVVMTTDGVVLATIVAVRSGR